MLALPHHHLHLLGDPGARIVLCRQAELVLADVISLRSETAQQTSLTRAEPDHLGMEINTTAYQLKTIPPVPNLLPQWSPVTCDTL